MVKIILLRHGESEWNLKFLKWRAENGCTSDTFVMPPHRFNFTIDDMSECDSMLTPNGQFQALSANLSKFPDIKQVLCSPLRRTIQAFELTFQKYPPPLTQAQPQLFHTSDPKFCHRPSLPSNLRPQKKSPRKIQLRCNGPLSPLPNLIHTSRPLKP
jgi:broad specificity phosphatase PhoE